MLISFYREVKLNKLQLKINDLENVDIIEEVAKKIDDLETKICGAVDVVLINGELYIKYI